MASCWPCNTLNRLPYSNYNTYTKQTLKLLKWLAEMFQVKCRSYLRKLEACVCISMCRLLYY